MTTKMEVCSPLDNLESHLSLLLGPSFAHPNHTTAH
jgi:hypothetical protein